MTRALVLTLTLAAIGACGGSDSASAPRPPVAVARITVTGASTLTVGQSDQFSASAFAAGGTSVSPAPAFTWSSSAPAVASVDQTGRVQARAAGQTTIAASAGGVTGTLDVQVRSSGATPVISTLPNSFVPDSVAIAAGGSVVFAFGGGIDHNVMFNAVAGAPNNIPTARDQQFTRTFSVRGSFPFQCTLHPGMNGKVVVQ